MGEIDDERVAVQTYVPQYQREAWLEEADERGMSQAEYVRTMVQAGRRELQLDEPVEADNSRSYPEGDGLEERTVAVLRERAPCEWEALVAALTDDLEDRLEAALDELQQADHVRYDGRRGGYVAIKDGE